MGRTPTILMCLGKVSVMVGPELAGLEASCPPIQSTDQGLMGLIGASQVEENTAGGGGGGAL